MDAFPVDEELVQAVASSTVRSSLFPFPGGFSPGITVICPSAVSSITVSPVISVAFTITSMGHDYWIRWNLWHAEQTCANLGSKQRVGQEQSWPGYLTHKDSIASPSVEEMFKCLNSLILQDCPSFPALRESGPEESPPEARGL